MSALIKIQSELCRALNALPGFFGKVPVISEIDGDVVAERDAAFLKQHLAVIVGAARFEPQSRNSGVITGMAKIVVTVYEQPSRNRIGQRIIGPTLTAVAEHVACSAHLMKIGDGVLVFTGLGDVVRVDDKTVARDVNFETLTTLTGEI